MAGGPGVADAAAGGRVRLLTGLASAVGAFSGAFLFNRYGDQIEAFGKAAAEKARAIFCAAFRHSRISTSFFGYQYCGRCGAQVGDTLASIGNPGCVFLKHRLAGGAKLRDGSPDPNCHCATVRLTWVDWALLPADVRKGDR